MTAFVSLLPQQTGSSLPAPYVGGLSGVEQDLMRGLSLRLATQAAHVDLRYAYYDGLQAMTNLGIAVPPQLSGLRTVVDWPRVCVDPIVQRCVLDGFLLPGATDVDDEFREHWDGNDLDAELPLAFQDALVARCGYMIIGSPDVAGDSPLVTVESPKNVSVMWDPRTRAVTAAYQSYQVEGVYRAALYLPDVSIMMSREDSSAWQIDDRDEHSFGEVPVVRLVNRSRSTDREGRSEITPAIMNTTDSACRSLLGMEIAREFYSVPHRYVLGASEDDFVDAQGNKKTAIEMAMNKFLALERDENGDLPQVGQFQAFDPSVYTKIVDKYAQLMASFTGYPPAYFGQTSSANPASADAIRVSENPLDRRGKYAQTEFGRPLKQAARLIWRFAHPTEPVPDAIRKIKPSWVDASTPTPGATTDAITKQVQIGAVPPTSDVTLARLGYNAVERARLAVDRQVDGGASILAELASSLQAKQARTDIAVAHDINPQAAKAPVDGAGSSGQ